jgi:diguanylate cyclase (GGDEF)-like protein
VHTSRANPQIQGHLVADGYEVQAVSGRQPALVQLALHRYQAIVLDIEAPGDDPDLGMIREAVNSGGDPAVLVCVSQPTVEMAVSAMRLGTSDFLAGAAKKETLLPALQAALEKRSATLELVSLRRLVGVFNSLQNLESTYTHLRESIAELFNAKSCSLSLLDTESGEIVAQTPSYGANWDSVPQHRFRLSDSRISKLIFESNEPYISNDIPQDPLFEPAKGRTAAGLANLMAVPMRSGAGIVGFIYLINRPTSFSRLDAELLLGIGEQVGLALKSAHSFDATYKAAITDPLTDLYNRRFFDARLRQEVARVRRTSRSLGLMFVDLDHFKQINDQYGHDAGNLVLTQVARIIRQSIRSADVPARWGGDEFTVLLTEPEMDSLEMIARRVRDGVEQTSWGPVRDVTATIGIAVMPNDAETIEDLLKAADEAMYLAKKKGKNTYALAGELRQQSSQEPAAKVAPPAAS